MSGRDDAALRGADAEARRLAQREFVRPLLVEAGAGTGKTATLVARVLSWCLGPGWERAREALAERADAPERVAARVLGRVVAITFTEAAAAEMAARVDRALADLAGGAAPPSGFDRAALALDDTELAVRARTLRGSLDHLVVHTIHAFCRRLLAAYPLEAGLHPHLEVDADGRVQAEVVRSVLEERLREAFAPPGDPALLALAEREVGGHELEQALHGLLDAGVTSRALRADPLGAERLGEVATRLGDRLTRFAAAAEPLRGTTPASEAPLVAAARTRERLAAPIASRADFERLLDGLRADWEGKVLGRLKAWASGQLTKTEERALGDGRPALCEASDALRRPIENGLALDLPLLATARPLLARWMADVEEELRRRGVLSFSGLLEEASLLLGSRPAVARSVRRGIDQLLVDEFQDTDARQCAIVAALALEGSADERPGLFLVGDPKQSIYGWRNADLAAYEDFAARLAAAGGLALPLVVNHRSVPALLDEVERAIAPVMKREAGVQPAFQRLLPSARRRDEPGHRDEARAPVEYWISARRDPGGPGLAVTLAADAAALEARALAADLRGLHDDQGVDWRRIGVLMRSRGDWDVYLGALREAGVPFAVEGDRSYYRRREIIDAAAFVRCVLDPADTLAFTTLLRSAVVGVPDAALVGLFARGVPGLAAELRGRDAESLAALRVTIDEVGAALPGDAPDLERVAGWEQNLLAALEALGALRASFERDPADVFVERLRAALLFEATEAARFLGAWRAANLERFFRGLRDDLAAGADVDAVLRQLRHAVADEEPREEEQPHDYVPDAVRVMTLHGAKGLDFDHVYLMQLQKGSARGGAPPLVQAEEVDGRLELRLLGTPTPGWDRALRSRQTVEAAELVRTLYVGMTRARERLVLAGLWPEFQSARASDGHVALLAQRRPAPIAASEVARSLAREGRDRLAAAEATWVFPALAREGGAAPPAAAPPAGLPTVETVRAQSDALRVARAEAAARSARPLVGFASAAAPQGDAEEPRRSFDDAGDVVPDVAREVGTAIHRVLETFDLGADPSREIERQRDGMEAGLRAALPPAQQAAALAEANARLDGLADGALLARLRGLRGRIVARELPVLLPPVAGDGPLGFVSGLIDLVHRDAETGELVVVDYKTDRLADEAALEERSRHHAAQGAVYCRALRDALDLPSPPRFELWYLALDRRVAFDADRGLRLTLDGPRE